MMFGRRRSLKKVADVDVMPTVFAPRMSCSEPKFRSSDGRRQTEWVLWIEMLGIRKLDLGHGEVFVSNEVQMYEAEEVREFVDPLFWMYLRGAEDVRF